MNENKRSWYHLIAIILPIIKNIFKGHFYGQSVFTILYFLGECDTSGYNNYIPS